MPTFKLVTIDDYKEIVGAETLNRIREKAKPLKGLHVTNINSTYYGGGVSQLLSSLTLLMDSVGIETGWRVVHGPPDFFTVTKKMHNALQGGDGSILKREETPELYQTQSEINARELDYNYDVFIINDPQPAAMRHYLPDNKAKWIWRCHVDSSQPDEAVWQFLSHYIEEHDAAVFTTSKFIQKNLDLKRIATMAPAIDPFTSKNMFIKRYLCREMLETLGIDRHRPLITQVSRFDRWKDPFGTIAAYQLAKQEVPGLQLAMIGSFAGDDPEGWEMYAALNEEANKDDDVIISSNLTGVGNMEVNAFQRASDLIVQKSIREGFGLVVAEALWKGTMVVAGNAGGIPLQMPGELGSYLVDSIEQCAEKIVFLLNNPQQRERLGQMGHEVITHNFLTPRLVRDELALIKELVNK